MRCRILTVTFLVFGVLGAGGVATSGDRMTPARQSAIVYLSEPTLIGSTIVQGPVLITHDEAKMKRGEPCTTVNLLEPPQGPAEEVASFRCTPKWRGAVDTFTVRTRPNVALRFGCILTEFQFAGDAEAHGMPTPADGD